MGDFAADTAVHGGEGRYRAVLSEDWNIWGPNGGYLAAIALRAAGAANGLTRPASLSCQFLAVPQFGPVDLEVVTLRASKRAAALRVSLVQANRHCLEALVWVVVDGHEGLEHQAEAMPDVPAPDAVPSFDERRRESDPPGHRFWENLEARQINWVHWDDHEPGEPRWQGWLRFRPTATFADPFVDAARSLLLIDTLLWPAACGAHAEITHLAPSLQTDVRFHQAAPEEEWLLCDAYTHMGAHGLLGGTSNIWSRDGRLLASGGGQMFCRPIPQAPQGA